ncbi:ATP-dependent helicase HrpB [Vibrio sp. SM6]|uniref:ATP-dependent helicase HrpB n=1 Tax=Vibrio agarilyticus TaxID=2726741 RepID=A0A7X8YGW5_9VIBR|nr:ATP-dependent helicase HrpB [Vibrio agarilyticus]NLS12772.1 ATP-dependent helicase HrpB [Vibrio agarilyticus]
MSQLPIQAVMPDIMAALASHCQLILKADPGAGKSTHFPLQLLLSQSLGGKIIMLEPRRLAARSIAHYLATQLGETVGERVGYRLRGETKVSDNTQLEIVTEGVMTRLLQADPELSGVAMLIFDEYHERSLHADLALALSIEVQEVFRPDLKLVVMSATLDETALATLLPNAAFVASSGRSFAVEQRYQPLAVNQRLPDAMFKTISTLLRQEAGSILAFLPGVSAIRQTAERLTLWLEEQEPAFANSIKINPLYGQLSLAEQQQAIAVTAAGERKVVLATNIAETSLTIEGIGIVVDSGLERVARFDVKTGLTRLEQVRIAQSSAIQRAGRAGRVADGLCVRLYSETQFQQQPKVASPEIVQSDLASLMLELLQWGASDINQLRWLDTPPMAAIAQAKQLLHSLQLIDNEGQLTEKGRAAHALGCEPRLAAMLLDAQSASFRSHHWLDAALAAAAIFEEPERQVSDLSHSLHNWQHSRTSMGRIWQRRAQHLARALGHSFSLQNVQATEMALVLALAFPDRIAQRRVQQSGRFLLANGHGGQIQQESHLADCDYLVAVDLMRSQGNASEIKLAAALDIDALEHHFAHLFQQVDYVDWDDARGVLVSQCQWRIGELVVRKRDGQAPNAAQMSQALLNYVRRVGLDALPWSDSANALRTRICCASVWLTEEPWPDCSEQGLLDSLEVWLAPYLQNIRSVKQLQQLDVTQMLDAYLGWPLNQHINQWLPTHYTLATGNRHRIHYQLDGAPKLSVRMQEMFGEQTSPLIAKQRQAVVVELLSPAMRPLQVTRDLASFWAGSYKEVQKEMKGRYPKHVWPDDPATHQPTTQTKRQMTRASGKE